MIAERIQSTPTVYAPKIAIVNITTTVDPFNSSNDGQVHFFNSSTVSSTKFRILTRYPLLHMNAKSPPITTTQIIKVPYWSQNGDRAVAEVFATAFVVAVAATAVLVAAISPLEAALAPATPAAKSTAIY